MKRGAARVAGGIPASRPTSDAAPSPQGLSEREAAQRLADAGPNTLPEPRADPLLARIVRHLREPMALLLIAAAVVSGVALDERVDAVAIITIVLLNTGIGLVQEGKAARALEALRAMESPVARVRRDGTIREIAARDLVPGDVVLLAGGDRVPADVELLETASFEVDESLLTGESLPVAKDARAARDRHAGLADRRWMAHAGTHATRGSATAVVSGTGVGTALGAIAERLQQRPAPTPLQRELARLTAKLGIIAVVIAAGVFGLMLARTGLDADGLNQSFLAAVALAVAAVPEGLATVVTVALALGVRRMARRNAIVRRLPAVETLGATTVILTDKTGTLTENRMHVEQVLGGGRGGALSDRARDHVERIAILCNDAEIDPPSGDPLEVALLDMAGTERAASLRAMWSRIGAIPFEAERRRMTTIIERDGEVVLTLKGAPETVLNLCTGASAPDGSLVPLDEDARAEVLRAVDALAARGARVIGLAERRLAGPPEDLEKEEHDLVLIGMVGLRDRIRDEAAATVSEARGAGIDVIMVTGDHAATGLAVASEVGIERAGARALTGADLRANGLPEDPRTTHVYARVDPDEKLALVEALQARGEVLAVTGDGVNDAPALRRADIGVAMGARGSDVAKNASDMIVTDDNLATVVAAVHEGRGIYDNIRKVVDYLIAGNLSEIMVVVIALIVFPGLGIPLLPLQLLWINLLTDGLPALALGVDPFGRDLMQRPPRPKTQRLLSARRLGFLMSRASLIAVATIGALMISRFARNQSWDTARALMFTVLVTSHLLWAFAARWPSWRPARTRRPRHERPAWRTFAGFRWLIAAVALGLALQITIVVWGAAHDLFGTAPLDALDWMLVAMLGCAPLAVMAAFRMVPEDRA